MEHMTGLSPTCGQWAAWSQPTVSGQWCPATRGTSSEKAGVVTWTLRSASSWMKWTRRKTPANRSEYTEPIFPPAGRPYISVTYSGVKLLKSRYCNACFNCYEAMWFLKKNIICIIILDLKSCEEITCRIKVTAARLKWLFSCIK